VNGRLYIAPLPRLVRIEPERRLNLLEAPARRHEIDESHTGPATGAGIGASIRVYKELSVDIDARYVRLDRDQNLGRFGGGVSYRF
jgi:hypothetical protein